MVIAGTAIVASFSSTAFLQLFTHPYVISLQELPLSSLSSSSISPKEISDTKERRFLATRLNIFGNDVKSEFSLQDVRKINVSANPFASFSAQDQYYYINSESLNDAELKRAFNFE